MVALRRARLARVRQDLISRMSALFVRDLRVLPDPNVAQETQGGGECSRD
jgi:hypothetical protein